MPEPDEGLHAKYRIERVDDPSGRHAECDMFVLDVTHDTMAREALAAYASVAWQRGMTKLAEDLDALLAKYAEGGTGDGPSIPRARGPHAKAPTPEERERIRAREYPEGLSEAVDVAGSAVFAEFPGDSWRNASLREVVGVVVAAAAPKIGAWQAAAAYVAERADDLRREGWRAAVERLTAAVVRSPYDGDDAFGWRPMCGDMKVHDGHRYAGAWCTGVCGCTVARPPHAPSEHK